jgi:formylglycine-generating enzyme required for sulfatase activity
MNEPAVRPAAPYAQARVREPAGDRTLGETFSIGGAGADIVVPGVPEGVALRVDRRKGVWVAEPLGPSTAAEPAEPAEPAEDVAADVATEPGARRGPAGVSVARFDGRPLITPRDLRRNDVLALGDAQLIVTDVSRTLLRLDVCHLVGNATIPPANTIATLALGDGGDEELEIRARGLPVIPAPRDSGQPARGQPGWQGMRGRPVLWIAVAVVALAVLGVGLISMLDSVPLDIVPGDARVRTPGTLVSWRSGDRLWVLPGTHAIRAEREGYVPAETEVDVGANNNTGGVRFRLVKLPGKLHIDTGGIAVVVSIDGADSARAPGDIDVPSGDRTITLRAPRYLDYVAHLTIEGAGAKQTLTASLKPAWGTVEISTVPTGAQINIDGVDSGVAPQTLEIPSGVRRVEISAPGLKTWDSSVVVKAGEKLTIGPVTLGQPDAKLILKSQPAGAEVTVAGTHRGKTPLEVALPAGVSHEVVVDFPGYATWSRAVFADPGREIAVEARLEEVDAAVTVQGDPQDAQLFVDGAERGRTPQTMQLQAIEHRIEVRKDGFIPFTTAVTPEAGLERQIRYHLVSSDRAVALQESAPLITTGTGYSLRLIPVGTFTMGSERREQGRRPNEGFKQVTLKRPFYLGVTEITNGEFRKFRPEHVSGVIDKHSIDLDSQPVTQVSWNDAAEYCNWLSEHDGLPPAYEMKDNDYKLKRPVTTGYRLPTEAEWEYAARYSAPGRFRRFAWGDSLPVPEQIGNIAGVEAAASLPASLSGYRDEYPVLAPVGKFKPSPLGLQDMSGNASEWIDDYYLSFVDPEPATDPLGPDDGTRHVLRGANWKSAVTTELRLAWRDGEERSGPTIGFRIGRYAE